MAKHSKYGPSRLGHVLACHGSVDYADPSAPSSPNAEEGVLAHALLEHCLKGQAPGLYRGPKGEEPSWEMIEHIARVRDVIMNAGGGRVFPELQLDLSAVYGVPGEIGTLDAASVDGSVLDVHDLKYGYVEVRAEENPQLMAYALGFLERFDPFGEVTIVRLWIHQPRLRNEPDVWEAPIARLMNFRQEVRLGLQAIEHGDRELVTGPHCKYCEGRAKCPKLTADVSEAVFGALDAIDTPSAEPVVVIPSPEELARRYGKVALIEAWCEAVKAYAIQQLTLGQPVPGYKLVAGKRGARKFPEDVLPAVEAAMLAAELDPYAPRKLLTPSQAENAHGKDFYRERLEQYVVQPEGKPTIAPDTDNRPALKREAIEDLFD